MPALSHLTEQAPRGRHDHGLEIRETVALLAARAPKLRTAVRDATRAGNAYVVLDGTLIPVDRVAADRPFYSGKHRKHGMNLQVIASPGGDILWVSGELPGSVHDKKAEWIWGVLAELEVAGLVTLADKGYQGSAYAKIPYRGKNKPGSQKEANKAHAKLRSPGERANAQLKNWRILRSSAAVPGAPGNSPRPSRIADPRSISRIERVQAAPAANSPGDDHDMRTAVRARAGGPAAGRRRGRPAGRRLTG
jgi:hypothetical protein